MKLAWHFRERPSVVLVAGLGGLFTVVGTALAQPWRANSLHLSCTAVATSADGRTIVAAAAALTDYSSTNGPIYGPIYVSTDAGGSWTQTTAPSNLWSSVACSADGIKLVAASPSGRIYLSPDAGTTWTPAGVPSNYWICVVSSADGAKLAAVDSPLGSDPQPTNYVGGAIYRSSDAGATWMRTSAPSTNWTAVASSADGSEFVAISAGYWLANGTFIAGGGIYSSLDSGATWKRTAAPDSDWSCVASSADGSTWVAAASGDQESGGSICLSRDSGATWTATSAPSNRWACVACSADGSNLVASGQWPRPSIYISIDSGQTWFATGVAGAGAVASSADGYRLVAAGRYGQVFTWPYSGPWRLANAPASDWESVACSADGGKLVAVGSGTLYSSADSGATWTQAGALGFLAASADFTKLVAARDGSIYISGDFGATWARTSAPSNNWTSAVSSADGSHLVAFANPLWSGSNYVGVGAIYRSSDSGATWARSSAPSNVWHSASSSANGIKLVAVGEGGICRSVDAGATWTAATAPSGLWTSVASSADGSQFVAAVELPTSDYRGTIYRSGDSGATWVQTGAPIGWWRSVASSADGTTLFAATFADGLEPLAERWDGDSLKISTDSGASWRSAGLPGWPVWGIASSADGSTLVAAGYGHIATLHAPAPAPPAPPSPQLAVGRSGGNLVLSWLVPSTGFVLQAASDLRSSDWMAVPTPPTLNFTNLHFELTVTPVPGEGFYRLAPQ